MKKQLSKDKFISIINSLKQVSDMLNELYEKYGIDLIDCNLDQSVSVESLLEYIFDDEDTHDIGWWCWETDFGRDYPSCVVYENIDGKEITREIDTVEKLYDFLISNMNTKEREEHS